MHYQAISYVQHAFIEMTLVRHEAYIWVQISYWKCMLPHILHIILYLKGFQDEPSDELDPPQ